jgi:hypothetical protein
MRFLGRLLGKYDYVSVVCDDCKLIVGYETPPPFDSL